MPSISSISVSSILLQGLILLPFNTDHWATSLAVQEGRLRRLITINHGCRPSSSFCIGPSSLYPMAIRLHKPLVLASHGQYHKHDVPEPFTELPIDIKVWALGAPKVPHPFTIPSRLTNHDAHCPPVSVFGLSSSRSAQEP